MLKRLIAVLAGTLSVSALMAAPGGHYTIDAWGTEQGLLPQSSVIAMTQTRDGYLWLGTLNGLVRFDGVHFTVFDESNTPKLESIRIVKLFEDSRSNLWVGTESAGAFLVTNGQVIAVNIGRGHRSGHLVSVCEDPSGAVWMLTQDGDVGRFNRGVVDVWNLGQDAGVSVIAEKGGHLWIGTRTRIFGLDPAAVHSGAPLPVTPGLAIGGLDMLLASRAGGYWCLADGNIRKFSGMTLDRDWGPYPWSQFNPDVVKAACEDQNGNLIVGTGGTEGQGIFWFGDKGRAERISTQDGLANNSVYCLDADAEGALWVGLDGGGLNRVKHKNFQLIEPSFGEIAQSLCPDQHGGLWVSAKFHEFSYWKTNVLHPFLSRPGPISLFNPTAILADRKERVWGATFGGGLFYLSDQTFVPAPGFPTPEISALFEDHSGNLWAGTQAGLAFWNGAEWALFTTNNGLSANIVRAIAEDRAGHLWIGTERGGLNEMRDGHFTSLQQSNGFPSDNISSLCVDADDVLWIGTFGNGLIRLRNGKWTHYTTKEGLTGNSVDYLIDDGHGFLWIGSNAGLMRAPKKDLNDFAEATTNFFIPVRGYDKRDGLPASECTFGSQPAACRAPDGNLWFPTIAGVVSVNPLEIHSNTNPPPVVIDSILVEGVEQNTNGLHTAPPQLVTVPPGKEHLEIEYTSLNLGAAGRARFSYRLDGHDAAWSEPSRQQFANYVLPPGHYRFDVRACNEDGVWNNTGASLAVIILPYFWQTRSFRAGAVLALLAAIVATVYLISTQKLQRQLSGMRQQQALERERARIARDIHDQVGANLTQLALLGEMVEADKDDPAEAESHARQISLAARETTKALDEIVWTVNPSNDTLDGLVNYICKHAQDYLAVAGLRYRLDVPAELPAIPISPETRHNVFLAAKESVTNIVKHARATEASIRLRVEPDRFTLEIEDNGRGPGGVKTKAAELRNGMKNMRKRMEDIGGEFFIGPRESGGAIVRLTVPLAKN